VCTGFGRGLRLTERSVQRLPNPADVHELDINDPEHVERFVGDLSAKWDRVDGALHAIAFAPADALGGNFLSTPPESAATAFMTSAFSYKTLAVALRPLMTGGGSLVTLDFDNSQAWPAYDWMGVAKSALQSVTRYLARDLGGRSDPGQRRVGRAAGDGGGEVDPGLRPFPRSVERAGAAAVGRDEPRARRPYGVCPHVGLDTDDDRRDHPRRRRVPCSGCRRRWPQVTPAE
jgi:NAD(P)-dependent dehydrogenase (short-subunit alcohol dehydrogenase family)